MDLVVRYSLSIALMTFSLYALDQSEKSTLVFERGIDSLRDQDWETIDDKDALNLCMVNKKWQQELQPQILTHRKNKIEKLNNFMKLYSFDMDPCQKFSRMPSLLYSIELSNIIPSSLMVGPSGNYMYGLRWSKIPKSGALCLQRIRCKIQPDGSIRKTDIQIIDDAVCTELTQNIDSDHTFTCVTDENKKWFAIIFSRVAKQNKKQTFRVLIGNVTKKSYSYAHKICAGEVRSEITDLKQLFDENSIVQTLCISCNHGIFAFKYYFDKRKKELTCYEHVVATDLDEPNPQNTISLHNLYITLKNYILTSWPTKEIENIDTRVQPKSKKIMHCYKPDEAWPREIFKNHFEFRRDVKRIQSTTPPFDDRRIKLDAWKETLESYDLHKLARHFQMEYLGKLSIMNEWILHDRCLMKRSEDATIYCNAYGEPYYCPSMCDPDKDIRLLDNGWHQTFNVYQPWAYHIKKERLSEHDAEKYLNNNRAQALQVSAQEFVTFYTNQAWKYAQRTWDNGAIGAYWYFDNDVMRIRLYDLKIVDNNRVHNIYADCWLGTYLIPGCRDSVAITDVLYVPGQEPFFCLNGRWFF